MLKFNLKKILSKKIFKEISDKKIEKIIEIINKYEKNFDEKYIDIKDSGRSFLIILNNIVIKCYNTNYDYCADYRPLMKLNEKEYKHAIKILYSNSDFEIIVLEKLESIHFKNKLLDKYQNKKFIKSIIVVVLNTIFYLFIHNSQTNKELSIFNIGIDKNDVIKLFDFESSKYQNRDNEFESKIKLYYSFENFVNNLISNIDSLILKKEISIFFDDFKNKLTEIRVYENPILTEKYYKSKVRMFTYLDFNSIVQYANKW